MHQDYYELENGRQAVSYVYEYHLGFAYGNALKYCVRAGRKDNNSAESDLNKALSYIESAKSEFSFIKRMIMKLFNTWSFDSNARLAEPQISAILKAIIKFDKPEKIARMIVKYMKDRGINVKPEYKCYESSSCVS